MFEVVIQQARNTGNIVKIWALILMFLQGESEVDVIAEQLKFRACLKILMTELRTLATGFEVDGGKLRFQLYSWLEKEIAAMHTICNYKVNLNVLCLYQRRLCSFDSFCLICISTIIVFPKRWRERMRIRDLNVLESVRHR